MVTGQTADQSNDQESNDRDGQHQQDVGDAALQPMHPHPPRAEPNLVKVEDPERQRNAEQNSADGCEREMQGGNDTRRPRLDNPLIARNLVKPPDMSFFPQSIDSIHKINLQIMS